MMRPLRDVMHLEVLKHVTALLDSNEPWGKIYTRVGVHTPSHQLLNKHECTSAWWTQLVCSGARQLQILHRSHLPGNISTFKVCGHLSKNCHPERREQLKGWGNRVLERFCISFPFTVDEGTVGAAEARRPLLNCTKCSCRERCLAGCTFFQTKNWELGELWGQVFGVPFQNRMTALSAALQEPLFQLHTWDWLWRIITNLSFSPSLIRYNQHQLESCL